MRTITSSRAEHLPIGELSKQSGVNIETIRYYERVKMLAPPPRTASGRRVYDSMDLRILVFIRRARELGFSFDEVRALLRLGGPEKASCREVREIAAHHLEDIRAIVREDDCARATNEGFPQHFARIDRHMVHRACAHVFVGNEPIALVEEQHAKFLDRLERHRGREIVEHGRP